MPRRIAHGRGSPIGVYRLIGIIPALVPIVLLVILFLH